MQVIQDGFVAVEGSEDGVVAELESSVGMDLPFRDVDVGFILLMTERVLV